MRCKAGIVLSRLVYSKFSILVGDLSVQKGKAGSTCFSCEFYAWVECV